MQRLRVLSFMVVVVFLLLMAVEMHSFGYPEVTGMDDYFIENSQEEAASNNVVAAVLFDYRGLDTLGEATILFTAIMGITVLFGKK